ncbi:MAG: phospholipid carrier-dependent glycosyltransferase [bacterium]
MWKNLFKLHSSKLFLILFILAVVVRVYGVFQPAQPYDIGTYGAWGNIMLDRGPSAFFSSTWSDYLPLPIYFCSFVVSLSNFFHLSFSLVFKLMVSLLEMGLLLAIWRVVKTPRKWFLFPLLILSPALIGDSAYWGQLDTIPSLLALLSLVILSSLRPQHLSRRTIWYSAFLFGIAVAFKPIILLILPVIIIILWKLSPFQLIPFAFVSFITFLLPALPVDFFHPLYFLITKSLEQASTYPNTTINAWNLWSILPLHNSWPPDNQSIFTLSAHNLGLLIFAVLAFSLFRAWRRHQFQRKYLFKVIAVLFLIFYSFTTRMHERHLFFGLPFLALAALNEPWLLIPSLLLTITFTLNLTSAFYWVTHSQTWPVTELFISLISWLNVLISLGLSLIWDWPSFFKKALLWLRRNHLLALIIMFALSLRLANLAYPDKYIFDEVYHSFTAREYLHNNIAAWEWWTTPPKDVAYEWTHPPVAKYGMVAGMLLFGENSFGWRFGSAVMGVISILGLYSLTLTLTKNKQASLLAAFLVSIEGLHLAQSRIGMNDIYMLAFLVWSLYCAVKNRWKTSALLFGLSLASKWSAVYGLVPLAVVFFHTNVSKLTLNSLVRHLLFLLRLLLIVVLVYLLTFTPFILAGHTWAQFIELHRQMWYYHTHLVATHAYESNPWQWLISLRPVWYFVDYGPATANIYAQSNPPILWFGLVALFFSFSLLKKLPHLLLTTCYLIFTLPWLLSPRIMFFYHYLPSAFFLTALLSIWLTKLSENLRLVLVLICVLSFILLSPVFFGIHMLPGYWSTLFTIFPSWK